MVYLEGCPQVLVLEVVQDLDGGCGDGVPRGRDGVDELCQW